LLMGHPAPFAGDRHKSSVWKAEEEWDFVFRAAFPPPNAYRAERGEIAMRH